VAGFHNQKNTTKAVTNKVITNNMTTKMTANSPVETNDNVEPIADGKPETIPAKIIMRLGTVVLAVFQSYGISIALQSQSAGDAALVTNPGFTFSLVRKHIKHIQNRTLLLLH
jgi:hypothetical protein